MSELKRRHINEVMDMFCLTRGDLNWAYVYYADDADKVIAELKENHKKEVDRLLMKIAGLEKLVETADKLLKQKGGFTINDVKFGGIKLEGINSHKKEADK